MTLSQAEAMDVCTEAKRVMVQALAKMYTLRTQRGGLRLHRSLLITLVMKSARDMYHSGRTACEQQEEKANLAGVASESCETTNSTTACVAAGAGDQDQPLAPKTQVTQVNTPAQTDLHCHDRVSCSESEDKENQSSTKSDRHSRKRRGQAAVAPDFLPCKKAKMEAEEAFAQRNAHSAALRATCCGVQDSLTHIPIPRSIVSF